jgi:hypothetical protein
MRQATTDAACDLRPVIQADNLRHAMSQKIIRDAHMLGVSPRSHFDAVEAAYE